jgi:pSer/pThr/pTyr-binding forkhead associated (FHA) protein
MTDDISPVLIAQSGPLRGERWVLSKSSLIIGRDSDCDIVIADNTVSRRHAVIAKRDSDWVIEDTSKNGTYVNEKSVEGTKRLNDGDFVSIATAVQIVFVGSDATVPLDINYVQERRMRLDVQSRRVWCDNKELLPLLSRPQYRLLVLLYGNIGDVCTRDEVVEAVWPDVLGEGVTEQSIDALVHRLRERLDECDPEHQYVETVRGHGFRLNNPLV